MHLFKQKSSLFLLWRGLYHSTVAQRELEEYEREQQAMRVKDHTAELHRKRVLKRAVIRGLLRNKRETQEAKRIEREHEQRKYAIDEFFENLKEKASREEERAKKEKLDKIQKDQIKEKLREVTKGYGVNLEERLMNAVQFGDESIAPSLSND
jgi:hypothetical protein